MLLAARAVADDDARQAVLALEADHEVLEGEQRQDQPARLVRHEFASSSDVGSATGAVMILKSLAPSALVRMKKTVAAFFEVVLQSGFLRRHQLRRAVGSSAAQQLDILRRLVVVDRDEDPVVVARAADVHEEARIGLFIDQPVLRDRRSRARGRTVLEGRWFSSERGCRRSRQSAAFQHAAAAGVGHLVAEVLAGRDVAHSQAEEFGALVVEGPASSRL